MKIKAHKVTSLEKMKTMTVAPFPGDGIDKMKRMEVGVTESGSVFVESNGRFE